jgi:hypothetical protein
MSFGPSVFDLVSSLKTEPVIASIDVLCASLCTVRCFVGVGGGVILCFAAVGCKAGAQEPIPGEKIALVESAYRS